jgi:ATP-independent RNA helicase DbpA
LSELSFSTLALHSSLQKNLVTLGYETMTAIQAQSLPLILAGKDVIAQGKTGSGKTAAFGLGVLQKLEVTNFRIQTLVLCPTRELTEQVANELRRLARQLTNVKILAITGGTPFGPQVGSLEHGAHIVVGTPGRIEDHLRRGTLTLGAVTTLVLDEADRMLDMGFQETLDAIIKKTPGKRQTLLFSATFPASIQSIAGRVMNDPQHVQVASTHDNATIEQHFFVVEGTSHRKKALRLLLMAYRPQSTLVFCNTKVETQAVTDMLRSHGFSAIALHGDLEQKDRDQTLVRFANKSAAVLVATDVAARGLDIDAVDAVINYEVANNTDVHVHRIGRTGRAGSKGIACSLYSENESYKVALLEANIDPIDDSEPLPPLTVLDQSAIQPAMATLQIDSGRKQKVRAGDILGA